MFDDFLGQTNQAGLVKRNCQVTSTFAPMPLNFMSLQAKRSPSEGGPVLSECYRPFRGIVSGTRGESKVPHHSHLEIGRHSVLPGEAENVRQVKGEVDDTTAGCCQAGSGEEGAEQEALHDRSGGESQQEQEEDEWVAIM